MNITRILAPNPGPFTGDGTNTYVVATGGEAVIIDPGPMIDAHLAAIREAVEGLKVVGVLVTHHHLDHAPAANPLAGELGVPSYGYGDYGGFQAISAIADGDGVRVGTEVIEVLHTPGHTADSLCFAVSDGVFTGDTIKAGTTVVVEDMSAYMATLDRLAALAPTRIYPGHGDVIEDGPGVIDDYITHRRRREADVVAALAGGPRSTEDIVASVYPGLDPALRPLATQSATAHLAKLREESRVERTGVGWALR
ncbi:MAG: MBL fold metallo-hydrolase [Acidimicrobiia bacterium]|nr:MBL fold metallo-hydrolase [Acidimicrobiia bacterium]MBT8193509.1 MBL fold metallo-hydrolase [Acidimicrobiia bacterium]MBT8246830.1 MBL fold metallo-hydrolase [Acidimicrobiia bacterium]NNF88771.1 MBL fold metallo-hydrolase [Acidimicrobiia bacterium]NNJ47235.1 MBL fold metallo-hydrolase [Acidimicrobiia bacterium]